MPAWSLKAFTYFAIRKHVRNLPDEKYESLHIIQKCNCSLGKWHGISFQVSTKNHGSRKNVTFSFFPFAQRSNQHVSFCTPEFYTIAIKSFLFSNFLSIFVLFAHCFWLFSSYRIKIIIYQRIFDLICTYKLPIKQTIIMINILH